jgi:TPR repeat protein
MVMRTFTLKAGNEFGQSADGVCLLKGEGIERNPIEAAKYYKMAADQGYHVSQWNYGALLMKGEGIERNPIEAAKYYKMAADQGNSYAQSQCDRLLPRINACEGFSGLK